MDTHFSSHCVSSAVSVNSPKWVEVDFAGFCGLADPGGQREKPRVAGLCLSNGIGLVATKLKTKFLGVLWDFALRLAQNVGRPAALCGFAVGGWRWHPGQRETLERRGRTELRAFARLSPCCWHRLHRAFLPLAAISLPAVSQVGFYFYISVPLSASARTVQGCPRAAVRYCSCGS